MKGREIYKEDRQTEKQTDRHTQIPGAGGGQKRCKEREEELVRVYKERQKGKQQENVKRQKESKKRKKKETETGN